ncbi:hypothetical protein J6590_052235 [Homalodisca vitripennis]|nr:hypothetical protein J6590_052235 [Homalodisca vitripennis]
MEKVPSVYYKSFWCFDIKQFDISFQCSCSTRWRRCPPCTTRPFGVLISNSLTLHSSVPVLRDGEVFLFYEMEKVPSVYREVTADHRRMFRALESSDLHWVAVNAAHITDDPPSGYTTRHGENTRYTSVSKHDLAKFLVDTLSMPEHFQKTVGIGSYPRR